MRVRVSGRYDVEVVSLCGRAISCQRSCKLLNVRVKDSHDVDDIVVNFF
jgi:hypothetical protein